MRKVCSLIFAAIVPGVGFSTASYAAAEPQGGSYVVSGNVTAVTAKGDATCLPQGAAIQGYSYFPGVQGKGKNFTIVIPPTSSEPGAIFSFPPMNAFSGATWEDILSYVQPPSAVTSNANFGLRFTTSNASSFSINLQTLTGPFSSSCTTSYVLNFKLGLPASLF
jgi:hypothetical protein